MSIPGTSKILTAATLKTALNPYNSTSSRLLRGFDLVKPYELVDVQHGPAPEGMGNPPPDLYLHGPEEGQEPYRYWKDTTRYNLLSALRMAAEGAMDLDTDFGDDQFLVVSL